MVRSLVGSAVFTWGVLATGCGLFLDYDGYEEAPHATSAGGSVGQAGGGIGGSSTGGSGGEAPDCPSGRGPSMVRVDTPAGSFCIDSTETTAAHYQEFLDDLGSVGPQPAACSWNARSTTNYLPTQPNDDPSRPVVGVDWCDAWAYCNWAGKRMCGRIGGGAVRFGSFAVASESQWYAACSAGGTLVFPYGNDYDGNFCNGADYPGMGLVAPTATCEGGYPGVFDMSGNAWEWENSCAADIGAMDSCQLRSGEFSNPDAFLRCDYGRFYYFRGFTSNSIGIRCCGP